MVVSFSSTGVGRKLVVLANKALLIILAPFFLVYVYVNSV